MSANPSAQFQARYMPPVAELRLIRLGNGILVEDETGRFMLGAATVDEAIASAKSVLHERVHTDESFDFHNPAIVLVRNIETHEAHIESL